MGKITLKLEVETANCSNYGTRKTDEEIKRAIKLFDDDVLDGFVLTTVFDDCDNTSDFFLSDVKIVDIAIGAASTYKPMSTSEALESQDEQDYHEMIAENSSKIFSDLPKCTHLFYKLEQELGGKSDSFAEWLRIAYEINSDFELAPVAMASEICEAFRSVKQQYGAEIARSLYDAQSIVLPNEILSAARYLHLGGQMNFLPDLASVGFLMQDLQATEHADMLRVVEFMNEGGAAEDAYKVLSAHELESGMSHEMG